MPKRGSKRQAGKEGAGREELRCLWHAPQGGRRIACHKGVTAARPPLAFRHGGSSCLTSSILAISAIYPLGGLFGNSSGRLVAVLAASEGILGRSWPLGRSCRHHWNRSKKKIDFKTDFDGQRGGATRPQGGRVGGKTHLNSIKQLNEK